MTRRSRVFVVHGHDLLTRDAVAEWLTDRGLDVVVLARQPDDGLTVIEKFEKHAKTCEFAVVILTPDDRGASVEETTSALRARQNVIFEMGWFFAKLGRRNTILLHRGPMELPSDVTGILYRRFEKHVSEVFGRLEEALHGAGLRLESRKADDP